MPRLRTGSLYYEDHHKYFSLQLGYWIKIPNWCAEITVDGHRYRHRSTSYADAAEWLRLMLLKFPSWDYPSERHPQATTKRRNSICYVAAKGEGRNGKSGSARINFMK